MKKMKKIVKMVIAIVLCMIAPLANVEMNLAMEDYDSILAKMGTPQSVIDEMDLNYKKYICENRDSSETFESFEVEEVSAPSRRTGLYAVSALTSNDISISVYATGVKIGGVKYVKLYPSFRWKKSANLYNDTFAFALYSGWECKPDSSVALNLNALNKAGVVQQTRELTPSDASESGYAFQFPKECSKLPGGGYYEGYAYFYARKRDKSATNAISVKYIHDTAPLIRTSYGISIKIASISISSNSSYLQVYSKNMSFSYSYSTK